MVDGPLEEHCVQELFRKHQIAKHVFNCTMINTHVQTGRMCMSRQILEQVRDELIACRVVSSNKEFCESWLAKDGGYMRGLKFHEMNPSADALAICASKLGYYAKQLKNSSRPDHQDWCERFVRLRHMCQAAMETQARAKWMTAERMGL